MSKKKDRKRTRPAPPGGQGKAPEPRTEEKKVVRQPERRGGGLFRARDPAPSPYPPLGRSIVRGMFAVGSSPLLLALAFLGALAAWGAFAAVGAEVSPRVMVNLLALPPVHVYFDIILITNITDLPQMAFGAFIGISVGRAILLSLLVLLVAEAVRSGKPAVRAVLPRLPRVAITVFLILSVQATLVLTLPVLVQGIGGPGLGLIGVLLTLTLGLHYMVLGPVISATEGGTTANVMRRSFRAARLPGPRHLLLVIAYFSFVFWIATVTPTEIVAPATPGTVVWVFSLLASFVHVSVLGALAYRWLTVRELVPVPERARRGRSATR